jgi:bilirubin oxidase
MRGRKDVVLVPAGMGTVRFITQFETFYDDNWPYMYHCHMLTHEDDGMMGQFIVQSPPASVAPDFASQDEWTLFPNPTSGNCKIITEFIDSRSTIRIYDMKGNLMLAKALYETKTDIDLVELAPGIYICEYENEHGKQNRKLSILKP